MRTNCRGGAAISLVLLSACASPIEGLWPAPPESAIHTIYVSLDTWHATIALQRRPEAISGQPLARIKREDSQIPPPELFSPPSDHSSAIPRSLFEEWSYAERAWYLEDKRGLIGILRALLWPTDGIVEIGQYDQVWADRTPQPPSNLFVFRVTEEGDRRLRRHLHATLFRDEPVASFGQSVFYPARRSYHLFHTCHQYAAHALREAGLPISPFWAFNRTSLAWQLRRASKMAGEQ